MIHARLLHKNTKYNSPNLKDQNLSFFIEDIEISLLLDKIYLFQMHIQVHANLILKILSQRFIN